ncbi:MAG: S8 family serine peptidase [Gammaproteobacteria bacterium]
MNQHLKKALLICALLVPQFGANASLVADQLDRLLATPATTLSQQKLSQQYNFVTQGERDQITVNVYIKLRQSSFAVTSSKGRTSKADVIRAGLSRLPEDIREAVISTYKNRGMVSARLTLDQLRLLKSEDYVEWIEPWLKFEPQSDESHGLTGVTTIHAGGNRGAGQTIAVIDTEFSSAFSTSNPRVLGGWDLADNDADFTVSPNCTTASHGTQVASIAATSNGVAKDADLVLLKLVKDAECGATNASLSPTDVVDALEWVADHRAQFGISVVNMSLASTQNISTVSECENVSNAYNESLQDLADAGVAVVAAAGNTKGQFGYPACMPTTISVGAVFDSNLDPSVWNPGGYDVKECIAEACPLDPVFNPDDQQGEGGEPIGYVFPSGHEFAGQPFDPVKGGLTCPGVDRVTCYSSSTSPALLDILAPSDCATAWRSSGGENPCFDGTSAAAPFVAGFVALINAKAGGNCLSVGEIRDILTASPVLVTDGFNGIMTPRIDASVINDLVVEGQCNTAPPPPPPPPPPEQPDSSLLSTAALVAVIHVIL